MTIKSFTPKMYSCSKCHKQITDRTVSMCDNRFWHQSCLTCQMCGHTPSPMGGESLYAYRGSLICKSDYMRMNCVCKSCSRPISQSDLVIKTKNCGLLHDKCVFCRNCTAKLHTGDRYFMTVDNSLVCQKCILSQPQPPSAMGHIKVEPDPSMSSPSVFGGGPQGGGGGGGPFMGGGGPPQQQQQQRQQQQQHPQQMGGGPPSMMPPNGPPYMNAGGQNGIGLPPPGMMGKMENGGMPGGYPNGMGNGGMHLGPPHPPPHPSQGMYHPNMNMGGPGGGGGGGPFPPMSQPPNTNGISAQPPTNANTSTTPAPTTTTGSRRGRKKQNQTPVNMM